MFALTSCIDWYRQKGQKAGENRGLNSGPRRSTSSRWWCRWTSPTIDPNYICYHYTILPQLVWIEIENFPTSTWRPICTPHQIAYLFDLPLKICALWRTKCKMTETRWNDKTRLIILIANLTAYLKATCTVTCPRDLRWMRRVLQGDRRSAMRQAQPTNSEGICSLLLVGAEVGVPWRGGGWFWWRSEWDRGRFAGIF